MPHYHLYDPDDGTAGDIITMHGCQVPDKRRPISSSEVFEVSLKMLAFERDRFQVGEYKLDTRSIDLLRDRATLALDTLRKTSILLNGVQSDVEMEVAESAQAYLSSPKLAPAEAQHVGGVRRAVRKQKGTTGAPKTAVEHARELAERFRKMQLEIDERLADCKQFPQIDSSAIEKMRERYPDVLFRTVENQSQLRPGLLIWMKPIFHVRDECKHVFNMVERLPFRFGIVANPHHSEKPEHAEICIVSKENQGW